MEDSNRQKTAAQVHAIEESQRATEKAMAAVVAYVRSADKPTSEEAHAIIDTILAAYDCESPDGHIVAGGLQAAEPHERGSGMIQQGVAIVIDIFPRSKKTGYFADMTRTVCIGTPSPEIQKQYAAVLGAYEAAVAMIRPGVLCKDLHIAAQNHFEKLGYETRGKGKEFTFAEGFVHSLGHGVGKEVHEMPRISPKSDDVLQAGDVITIEPGLYYPGIGGVRIEDMMLVTKNGYRNLTQFGKKFVL